MTGPGGCGVSIPGISPDTALALRLVDAVQSADLRHVQHMTADHEVDWRLICLHLAAMVDPDASHRMLLVAVDTYLSALVADTYRSVRRNELCGTAAGYKAHSRAGEPVCESCTRARAAADSRRERRARAKREQQEAAA